MRPKIFFWLDNVYPHFGLAKFIQDNFDCELFSIFDIADKPKIFFQKQKLVNFSKTSFYHDHILKSKRTPDLEYLKSVEEKYNIPLLLIALNDRFFNHFNEFYKFSSDEILLILEDEIKLYEKILDDVKPDFLIMFETHQQHNHIFYEICKARNIKILLTTTTRIPSQNKSFHSDMFYLTDEVDKFLPLPDTIHPNSNRKKDSERKSTDYKSDESIPESGSIFKYFSAFIKFLSTNDTNVDSHFTYFGRNKLKVLVKVFFSELRKKYRESFMEKNLDMKIGDNEQFVYFPLHQEQERVLLIGAPFYTHQFEVIQHISKSLPIGYKLYVKDHPVMDVRGWRSVSEMKKIMSLYNVKLLHYSVDSDEIIKKSSLVISIKGSSALQAAFHHKPSIIFENIGLYQLPSIHKLKCITELPDAIRSSIKKKVNSDDLEKYLDATKYDTFESSYMQIHDYFQEEFKVGGYYTNVEIDSQKMITTFEKFSEEFTELALIHIEKIKEFLK